MAMQGRLPSKKRHALCGYTILLSERISSQNARTRDEKKKEICPISDYGKGERHTNDVISRVYLGCIRKSKQCW
jgi:hypothetical protein